MSVKPQELSVDVHTQTLLFVCVYTHKNTSVGKPAQRVAVGTVLRCGSAQWVPLLLSSAATLSSHTHSEAMDVLGVPLSPKPVTGKQPHTHEHFGRNPVSP